jgi:peptidyl-prolyl cis-trans isomerase SurA
MRNLLFVSLLIFAHSSYSTIMPMDGIAAVVDEDIITLLELEQRTRETLSQLQQRGTSPPSIDQLRGQILERLIIEKLQLELAKRVGVTIDDEQLARVLNNIAKENQLTLAQFRQALQKEGINYAQFREQIRGEVLRSQLKAKVVDNKVIITPREVDNHLATTPVTDNNLEYNLLHLLLSLPEAASPELVMQERKRAQEIHSQLRSGDDFRQLTLANSDGQQALEGGDLGWRKADFLPTLFTDEVLKMSVGDISPILRSSSGFHIIKLEATRGDERLIVQQVKARHILLANDESLSDAELEDRLDKLRDRISNGEDISELARVHSQDPGSARKGGDLGWSDPSIYVEAFQKSLAALKPGELSQPFKSQFGWHIILLEGRRDHDSTSEVQRNRAYRALRQRRIDEQQQSWLRKLRDEAFVVVYP